MKKISCLFYVIIVMLWGESLFAQTIKAHDVVGIWFNGEKDAKIEIYKQKDKYYGKIIWLKEPIDTETHKPKLDKRNPDPTKRNRPTLGLIIMSHFIWEDGQWVEGTIYDPKEGKAYNCKIRMEKLDKLMVRGYIGKSWMGLGRTTEWTRTQQ
ncbi:MAG: DUF2147 domain-containing protein [Lentimicrobiaceae bacterium]|nr:DUF2147 domain-containing protein [Lentimicrobiaceae bacterium]